MSEPLVIYDDLVHGTFLDRPNRFTIRVDFGDGAEPVYLRNSGGLGTVLDEGRTDFRLVSPADTDVYVEVKSNTYVVDDPEGREDPTG